MIRDEEINFLLVVAACQDEDQSEKALVPSSSPISPSVEG
jgi:hypothetical protein